MKESEFYPPAVRTSAERLRVYAAHFLVAEVDSTYCRLPFKGMVAGWDERTPPDFVFNVKAFRAFTLHPTPLSALPVDLRENLPAKANLYLRTASHEVKAAVHRREVIARM